MTGKLEKKCRVSPPESASIRAEDYAPPDAIRRSHGIPNPFVLRTAKSLWKFGRSECNSVKERRHQGIET